MSQFTLTPAEDILVVSALKYVADVQRSYGSVADDMDALLNKIAAQQAPAETVTEVVAEVVVEATEPAAVEQVEEVQVTG